MELITVEELGTDLGPIFDRISRSHEALSVKGKGNQSIVILDAKDYRKLVRHRHPERQTETKQPRPVGVAKGIFQVPPSFFEELPEELLNAFEGKTG